MSALLTDDSARDIAQEDLEFLTLEDRRVVLAGAADGSLVGFASVCEGPQEWERQFVPDLAPELELVKLYTLAGTHGSGLGERLLHAAVGSSDPVYLWIMSGNARAEAFYRKHGFRELAPRFPAEGPWKGQDTHRLRRP